MILSDVIQELNDMKRYELETYLTPTAKKHYKALDEALETMNKYQELKSKYDARFHADLMAMLYDVKQQIIELDIKGYDAKERTGYIAAMNDASNIVEGKVSYIAGCYLRHPIISGKWLKKNDDHFDWYECSICGYGSEGEMPDEQQGYDIRTNYCPNCGARMR